MKRNACALAALWLLLGCLLTGCGSGGKAEPSGTWQENYDLGIRYLSEGNYKEAVLAFQAAVRIDPKRVETYVALAEAQIASGEQEAAVKTLREGIDATGKGSPSKPEYFIKNHFREGLSWIKLWLESML